MCFRELRVEGSCLSSSRLGRPTRRSQVPASFSFSGLTIKAVLPRTSLREGKKKKTEGAPRLLLVIVSFISGRPDRWAVPSFPLFLFFFYTSPQMG